MLLSPPLLPLADPSPAGNDIEPVSSSAVCDMDPDSCVAAAAEWSRTRGSAIDRQPRTTPRGALRTLLPVVLLHCAPRLCVELDVEVEMEV